VGGALAALRTDSQCGLAKRMARSEAQRFSDKCTAFCMRCFSGRTDLTMELYAKWLQ